MTRYICVTGAKGGVGKTTTAVNLASGLHKKGSDALLVEANVSSPNVHVHLGADEVNRHLHDAIKNNVHVAETIYKHSSGLRIIPAMTDIDHLKYPHPDGLKDAILDLEGHADHVIIDGAAGLGREAIAPMEVSDEVLIVTTPDAAAVSDALKTIEVARELGKPVLGIILNQVRKDKLEHTVEEVEEELKIPVIGIVPYDDKIRKAWHSKNPVVHSHPNSPASKEFLRMAEMLIGPRYVRNLQTKNTGEKKLLKKLGL